MRSKIIRFLLLCQFQFLYQTLCVFLQIKDRKHIEQNFHSVARIMGQGWDLGCWGGGGGGASKTLAWGFAMAPHRLRVLVYSWSYFPLISNYPHAFLKSEGDIVIASVRLSVMVSPPKPLDEIQPNLVCELACNSKFFFGLGPGEGSKDQISFNFNYKVNFKDFYTKLCVCSHK